MKKIILDNIIHTMIHIMVRKRMYLMHAVQYSAVQYSTVQ